jgi:hypothetical protein
MFATDRQISLWWYGDMIPASKFFTRRGSSVSTAGNSGNIFFGGLRSFLATDDDSGPENLSLAFQEIF